MANNTVKGELMNSYELLAVWEEIKLQVCPFLETGDTEKEVVLLLTLCSPQHRIKKLINPNCRQIKCYLNVGT